MATATRDAVLASAVDLARRAAEEVAERPELVGEHLGVVVEGERLVSHSFASTAPGYVGWRWTVTVARPARARAATVCEVDLLPGPDAILAPAWVPWSERLQPGDLGPGDVLPYRSDDDRLDQGYEATGDVDADELAVFELGLGRPRVLSRTGRSEAAQRWYAGSHGPMAPAALSAAAPCSTCGFLLLMAGSLRTEFGVCANEWSPDDGRVVSMDHGCGAHSETDVGPVPSEWPDPAPLVDELDLDLDTEPVADDAPAVEPEAAAEAEPVAAAEPAEDEPVAEDEPAESEPAAETEPAEDASPAELAVALEPDVRAEPERAEDEPALAGMRADGTPADEVPAEEAPADDASAEEAPAEGAPTDEAPSAEAEQDGVVDGDPTEPEPGRE